MKYRIDKSFDRDVDRIQDKKVLKKLKAIISVVEDAKAIRPPYKEN